MTPPRGLVYGPFPKVCALMERDGFEPDSWQARGFQAVVTVWRNANGWEIMILSWTSELHQLVYLGVDNSTPLV